MAALDSLRQAIEQVIHESCVVAQPHDCTTVLITKRAINELNDQYRLHFVEPEDDKDWKNYQEPLDSNR